VPSLPKNNENDNKAVDLLDMFTAAQHARKKEENVVGDLVRQPTEALTALQQGSDRSSVLEETSKVHDSQPAHDLNNTQQTQSSNVGVMKEAFKAMMQPEQITQGDTQTQAPMHANVRSETTASPTRGFRSTLDEATTVVSKQEPPSLSQVTSTRLDSRKSELRQQACVSTKTKCGKGKAKRKNVEVVSCQCGFQEEEGAMVSGVRHHNGLSVY